MPGDVAVGVGGCEGGREAAFGVGAEGGGEGDGLLDVELHFGVFCWRVGLGLGLGSGGFLVGG